MFGKHVPMRYADALQVSPLRPFLIREFPIYLPLVAEVAAWRQYDSLCDGFPNKQGDEEGVRDFKSMSIVSATPIV